MSSMRTLGIIGGLGPESTIDYYRSIIARCRVRKPEAGYPYVIINSLDVDEDLVSELLTETLAEVLRCVSLACVLLLTE